jgi:hypothetical protein
VLIAGEGRKFGLHLLVATQRPGKVHPNVVSQCDSFVLMRMNGAADVEELTSLFSHVPAPLLRRALGFDLGQARLAGPISPVPVLVQVGARHTPEGGGDVPTTWTTPRDARPLEDGGRRLKQIPTAMSRQAAAVLKRGGHAGSDGGTRYGGLGEARRCP